MEQNFSLKQVCSELPSAEPYPSALRHSERILLSYHHSLFVTLSIKNGRLYEGDRLPMPHLGIMSDNTKA